MFYSCEDLILSVSYFNHILYVVVHIFYINVPYQLPQIFLLLFLY